MQKHVHYFDHLRLIAAISVIYMHVAAGPLRASIGPDWQFINFFTCLGFIAVPLFFMMSGYLLLSNQKTENMGVLFKKRIPRLLIPLVGWTVAALLWSFLKDKNPAVFFERLVGSLHDPVYIHFWYVYTLIAIYMIAPVLCAALRTLNKKAHILIFIMTIVPSVHYILQVLFPSALERFIDFDIVSKLTFLGGHLNTFVLGYYVGNLKKKIPNWLLLVSGGLLLAVITYGTYFLTVKNGAFTQTFQLQAYGFEVLLAAIVFIFFKQNFNAECAFYKKVPIIPLALAIYFMHNILLSVMPNFLPAFFPIKTFLGTLLITALNLLICYLVTKTVATIKPVCFLATGIPYKEACQSCNWIFTYHKLKSRFSKTANTENQC